MVGEFVVSDAVAMMTRSSVTFTTTPECDASPRDASSRGTSVTRRTATTPLRKRDLSAADHTPDDAAAGLEAASSGAGLVVVVGLGGASAAVPSVAPSVEVPDLAAVEAACSRARPALAGLAVAVVGAAAGAAVAGAAASPPTPLPVASTHSSLAPSHVNTCSG